MTTRARRNSCVEASSCAAASLLTNLGMRPVTRPGSSCAICDLTSCKDNVTMPCLCTLQQKKDPWCPSFWLAKRSFIEERYSHAPPRSGAFFSVSDLPLPRPKKTRLRSSSSSHILPLTPHLKSASAGSCVAAVVPATSEVLPRAAARSRAGRRITSPCTKSSWPLSVPSALRLSDHWLSR